MTYDLNERVVEGKIIYRFPYVNNEKTSKKNLFAFEKKQLYKPTNTSLVEIDYREETRESLFDPIVFIMHYQGEYEETRKRSWSAKTSP